MAITNKPTLPSPASFTSDPLESVFAHQMPQLGGLAYMFMNAARDRREQGQQDYTAGVDKANNMAAALARLELAQKDREEVLKGTVSLIGHGILPSSMPGAADLISNIPSADAEAKTIGDLRRAQAQEALMKGANAGGGGVTITQDELPWGPGGSRVVSKGKDADTATATAQAQAAKLRAQYQTNRPAGAPQYSPEQMKMIQDRLNQVQ